MQATIIDYQALLEEVMRNHPDLCANGFRTTRNTQDDFDRQREGLRDDNQQFRLVYDWCAKLKQSKSARTNGGYSYGLKNVCEKAIGNYITNGTLIAAMIAHGFKFKRHLNTPNCSFAVSIRSVNTAAKNGKTTP